RRLDRLAVADRDPAHARRLDQVGLPHFEREIDGIVGGGPAPCASVPGRARREAGDPDRGEYDKPQGSHAHEAPPGWARPGSAGCPTGARLASGNGAGRAPIGPLPPTMISGESGLPRLAIPSSSSRSSASRAAGVWSSG